MADSSVNHVRRIAGRKGQITKLINNIRDTISNSEDEHDVRSLQQKLEDARDVFVDDVFAYLDEINDEEDKRLVLKQKEQEIERIDRRIEEVNDAIISYIKDIKIKTKGKKADISEEVIHLERLNLPRFSGKNYWHWRSIFDVTVLSQTWSDKTKMLRLISCVEGEALDLIRLYPVVDASFHIALKRLENEYGGNKRLVSEAVKNVRKGKTIHEEDAGEIRKFISILESTRIVYEDQAAELDEAGALYQCARERLASGLLRQFLQWCNNKDVSEDFNSLIDFLSQWLNIIKDSKTDNINKVFKKPPITTYSQSLKERQSHVDCNSSYKVHCIWHKKEKNTEKEHYLGACDEFKLLSVEQKREFVFKNRLCFLCLKGNHTAKQCKNFKSECRNCVKGNRHHYLLHKQRTEPEANMNAVSEVESSNCFVKSNVISLQTVPVILSNGDRKIKINALLDPGSNTSFVSRSIAEELKLKDFGQEVRILNTVNNSDQSISVSRVKLTIESVDGKIKREETVMTLADMLVKSIPVNWQKIKKVWTHLRHISFPKLAERSLHEMLIGADLIYYHRCSKEIQGSSLSPIARLTPLGWSAVGPTSFRNYCNAVDIHMCEFEDLNDIVKKQWDLDSIGIRESEQKQVLSTEEKAAIDKIEKNLKLKDQRYETPILWKASCNKLTNNYDAVLRRTENMERKLCSKDLFKNCETVIRSYEDKHYVKQLSNDVKYEPSFYVPYFPIFRNERKTTKCRLVFDCAARSGGHSLNDQILAGPKLQNDIVDVMIRFRRFKYAIIGDISEMYLQILLRSEDRKFCRFIFNNKIYEWSRLIFGRSDAPFTALHVIRTHALKFKDRYGEAVDSILKSMYIDDLCDSRDDPREIKDLVTQSSEIFSKAKMDIKKWMTNCREVLAAIPSEDIATNVTNILDDKLPAAKTLGLTWDVNCDDICYTVNEITNFNCVPCSKRNILRSNARIFDPLGYLDPILITSKILFQCVWAAGIDWDEIAPHDIQEKWLHWYNQVKQLSSIRIPRHLGITKGKEFSLHAFCDASKQAYSAVIYVRVKTQASVTSRLAISKTRVTPLKSKSIPQLELMGATIVTRLAKRICQVLEFSLRSVVFWTDSMNVLYWIKRPAKYFKPFVSNRVGEIQSDTDPGQWRHCPTLQNPADIPTRGSSVKNLISNNMWWEGPDFLKEDPSSWPKKLVKDPDIEDKQEVEKVEVNLVTVCESDFPLNPARWSDKRKLIKRLGFVMRFVNNMKRSHDLRYLCEYLSPEELRNAEDTLIRICQQEAFSEDIKELLKHQGLRKASQLKSLNPFLDAQGLLRSRTRLEAIRWMSDEYKLPLILPPDHAVTNLVIKDIHNEVGHALGTNATLLELNKRFWIIKARVAVKRVQRSCMKCRIRKAKIVQPVMAPLPSFRFAPPHQCFAVTAIDFAGPYETKSGRGKVRNKRYMALFTCLQTRAVHLEMVTSLETSSFVNAFARMICRRGCPREVLTDNGSTFKKAEKELRSKMLQNKNELDGCSRDPIKWRFNPPYASHFGGVFEIMVKCAKRALSKILTKSDITDEELQTAFCHAEALLNSRPLTLVSDDVQDDLPLTPNHFLIGKLDVSAMLKEDDKREGLHPAKRWKYLQSLVQHFWVRWQKEVLHQYKSRNKWSLNTSNLVVGDIVIVLDPITTGRRWKLGRVTRVFPGYDQQVRAVDVCIEGKEFRRPVNKLCPLELNHV